jgi:hypothetical protein
MASYSHTFTSQEISSGIIAAGIHVLGQGAHPDAVSISERLEAPVSLVQDWIETKTQGDLVQQLAHGIVDFVVEAPIGQNAIRRRNGMLPLVNHILDTPERYIVEHMWWYGRHRVELLQRMHQQIVAEQTLVAGSPQPAMGYPGIVLDAVTSRHADYFGYKPYNDALLTLTVRQGLDHENKIIRDETLSIVSGIVKTSFSELSPNEFSAPSAKASDNGVQQ